MSQINRILQLRVRHSTTDDTSPALASATRAREQAVAAQNSLPSEGDLAGMSAVGQTSETAPGRGEEPTMSYYPKRCVLQVPAGLDLA